jgi:SNF2 family DNA or RNA helicase
VYVRFVRLLGKLATVRSMLSTLAKHYGERVVVVSNFTGTLDLIQRMCEADGHVFVRLDGSTPTEKRQALVDRFNLPASNVGVFLLSAKSGGVGLNLIGASRIVLVDPDWNPATDTQALARIWRDGMAGGRARHTHYHD